MRVLLAFFILIFLSSQPLAWSEGITRIKATPTQIHLEFDPVPGGSVKVVQLAVHENYNPANPPAPVHVGPVTSTLILPRLDGTKDRLYMKFLLTTPQNTTIGSPQFVTDISQIGARSFPMLQPDTVKGLQVQMVDDAIALGVKHAGINVMISQVLDIGNTFPLVSRSVDGQNIPINYTYLSYLDGEVKKLTQAGAKVYLIFLNGIPTTPQPSNPLIHPRSDLANAPNHLGAFNLTNEQGYRHYRAALEVLADRYSTPSGSNGWVDGYIIGNELQAHWYWYNIGQITRVELVEDYARALRIADLAVRRFHRDLRVYISMDHHWTALAPPGNSLQATNGIDLLRDLASHVDEMGDFPWHVAFHPYPQNLFEPRFWNDNQAPLTFSAQKITFNNEEILPAFLETEEMLMNGEQRRVIFSEQGFHTPTGASGEDRQAACYAYAYHKIRNTPGIDAFILHRHVDHRDEGGLLLGLWTRVNNPDWPASPERKKKIYDVFKYADTPSWAEYFAFALPVIGFSTWEQALPAPTRLKFEFDRTLENWSPMNQVQNLRSEAGAMAGTTQGDDPFIVCGRIFFRPHKITSIRIRMKLNGGGNGQLYWFTSNDPVFSESKSQTFNVIPDNQFHVYEIPIGNHPEWAGKEITGFRLDPTRDQSGVQFEVDYIRGNGEGPGLFSGWKMQ